MSKFKLRRTVQCAKCPWRVDTDPNQIPNGYDELKHRQLERTIAKGLNLRFDMEIRCMACHESHQDYCLGWLMNQLGPGNNIPLRFAMRNCENLGEVILIGEQHERFEGTLPQ